MAGATDLEKENLEAHVDLCQQRYEQLEGRLNKIEKKVESIHSDMIDGQKSMTKVLIGTAGTILAGLLSYCCNSTTKLTKYNMNVCDVISKDRYGLKSGQKVVRKYRCTAGAPQGQNSSDTSQCFCGIRC